jgi:hypothetical protein
MVSKNSSPDGTICKMLLSSRATPILSKRIRKNQVVSLTEERPSLELAIKEYTSRRLSVLHERFYQLQLVANELDEIKNVIVKKAHGEHSSSPSSHINAHQSN